MLFEKQVIGTFRRQFLRRCDDTGTAFYFSAADFPGLEAEPFCFPSVKGRTLKGYFYRYGSPIPGRLVVFDHGFGGGHRSYMKEIEMLCRHGYLVFSYDHTGCMESGGESIVGFSQSLVDLNDCLTALKQHPRCQGLDISVMGHSWGGFSTLNIAALHPEISHIVVLSGFVSVQKLVNQFFGGILKGYRRAVLRLEEASNPDFLRYDAVTSLSHTDAKVLLIYSENDKMVSKAVHFDALKQGLSHKDNVRFLLVQNKGHNPNYTGDAVSYLGEYSAAVTQKTKKKELESEAQKQAFLASFDWNRMTAQDETVWAEIFRTLDT
ncbi:MAG: alpha/beta fold hydrolase [Oscillospiraceae bacterium]|nr:alpha/beta fold hydrolase [Oscillospiraceae bacterium]